jgi:hypothetical protein
LIRLIDRSPNFSVSFLVETPPARSHAAPYIYFPGARELLQSHAAWNDIDFLLDIQAIRLVAPKPGSQAIIVEIPPFRNSVLKLPYKGSKISIIDDRAKYMNALSCRSVVKCPGVNALRHGL